MRFLRACLRKISALPLPQRSPSAGDLRQRPYVLFGLAFAGFFLMIGAWAVAAPYDASADEHDHIYRAYAVVSGEVMPDPVDAIRGSGAFVTVPRGLVRPWPADSAGGLSTDTIELPCWVMKVQVSAACAQPPADDRVPVTIGSGAGRYNPVYYAVVGLPLKLWPGWAGVLLARLISAAMSAALLAGAAVAVIRYSRYGLVWAALLVSITPTAMHFMGAVNPNGLEIAAGITLFAAGIPLFLGRLPGRPRGLLRLVGVSAACLALLRPTGLMFLAGIAVALLIPFGASNLKALWRQKAVRWWAAALVAVSALAVGWIIKMKSTDLGDVYTWGQTFTTGQAIVLESERWFGYVIQFIGISDWVQLALPAPIILLWMFAAATLLMVAIAVGSWIDRWRLFAVFLFGAILTSGLQVINASTVGFVTQGRYMMPMLVGLMVLSAYIIEERALNADNCRSLIRFFVILLLPLQLASLAFNMVRWQRGLPLKYRLGYLNPLKGNWHPVVGSVAPLLAVTIGAIIVAVLAWRYNAIGFAPAPRRPSHRVAYHSPKWRRSLVRQPVSAPAPDPVSELTGAG